MRSLYAGIAGFLSCVILVAGYHALVPRGTDRPDVTAAEAVARAQAATIRALQDQIKDLEEKVRRPAAAAGEAPSAARAEPGAEAEEDVSAEVDATPPTADDLSGLAEARDYTSLFEALEKLLLAGEEGRLPILEFLRAQAQPPRSALWSDRALGITLLSLALKHEDEAAELSRWFIANLDGTKDAALRDQLLRFLPAFLLRSGDGHPELRRELEASLLANIGLADGGNLWGSIAAVNELGVEIPIETLEAMLSSDRQRQGHAMALQQLAKRGDDAAVDLILRYVGGVQGSEGWEAFQALHVLSGMDNPRARQAFEQCLASPAKEVRESATMVYFSRPRGPEALPLAMSFLESDADINRKRMLIYNLLASSPAIFETLKKDVDTLSSEDVRQTIRKTGSAGTLQAAPAGGGIIQGGGSGTTGGT